MEYLKTVNLPNSAQNSSGTLIRGRVDVYYTQDVDNNTSTVRVALDVQKDNAEMELTAGTKGTWSWSLTVNGTKKSGTVYASILNWTEMTVMELTVPHDDDGTKTLSITASVTAPSGTTIAGLTSSGTVSMALPTIPRGSVMNSLSCATAYFNGKMTYKYTPQSASYYNLINVALALNGEYERITQIKLGKKAASQQTGTITLTDDEQETLYNLIPNTTVGTLRFTLRTYSDSGYETQVGDASYKEIRLQTPSEVVSPDVTRTLSPVHSLDSAFDGLYIQGKSKVKAAITATVYFGATLKEKYMKVGGVTYTEDDDLTSGYLTTAGSTSVVAGVKDSRGYQTYYTSSITVIAYSKPKLLNVVAARCDADGNLIDTGTYLKIKATRSYSKVVSGSTQKNFCQIQYRIKAEGGSWSAWTTILAGDSDSDSIETGALRDGGLYNETTYIVQVMAVDDIGESAVVEVDVPTERVYMHRDGARNSLGIGKYVESDNTVDIAEDIHVKARGGLTVGGDVDTAISDTGWISLGLSDEVAESESDTGRNGVGCFYRVINGNHVYVAFNCACEYTGEVLTVSGEAIPEEYWPERNAYAIVPTGGRALVRAIANHAGIIYIDWVQIISSAEQTAESTVKWIDGYIDYWI